MSSSPSDEDKNSESYQAPNAPRPRVSERAKKIHKGIEDAATELFNRNDAPQDVYYMASMLESLADLMVELQESR